MQPAAIGQHRKYRQNADAEPLCRTPVYTFAPLHEKPSVLLRATIGFVKHVNKPLLYSALAPAKAVGGLDRVSC